MEINIHKAKTNLSQLIRAMEAGEKVTICRAGKPVAHLTPANAAALDKKKRQLGTMRGMLTMSEGFDDPLPDEFWLGDEKNDPIYK